MFTMLFGAFAALAALAMLLGFDLFTAYVMYRIGDKFRIGSYLEFLIPVYNVMLLCDCAGITRWVTAGIGAPAVVASLLNFFSFGFFGGNMGYLVSAVFFFCWIYLWGSIAQRLGKNFWLWGVLSFFFGGLPLLILAFDGSLPRRR